MPPIRLPIRDLKDRRPIVRFNDTANDWATLQRLVGALERNAIRSLHPRPIEVGFGPGFDNWIIA
jgi:hypothetical protein